MKLCIAVLSSAFLLAPGAFAQKKPTQPKTTDAGLTKTKSHNAVGTVKEYNEGKSIVVTTAKGKHRKFRLSGDNLTANVPWGVAVGSDVKVVETKDSSGHKTVTVEPIMTGQQTRKNPS